MLIRYKCLHLTAWGTTQEDRTQTGTQIEQILLACFITDTEILDCTVPNCDKYKKQNGPLLALSACLSMVKEPYLWTYCMPGQTKARPPGTSRGFRWQQPKGQYAKFISYWSHCFRKMNKCCCTLLFHVLDEQQRRITDKNSETVERTGWRSSWKLTILGFCYKKTT